MRRAPCFQVAPYSPHCAVSSAGTLRTEITCRYSCIEAGMCALICPIWSCWTGSENQACGQEGGRRRESSMHAEHNLTANGRNWECLTTYKWKSDTGRTKWMRYAVLHPGSFIKAWQFYSPQNNIMRINRNDEQPWFTESDAYEIIVFQLIRQRGNPS